MDKLQEFVRYSVPILLIIMLIKIIFIIDVKLVHSSYINKSKNEALKNIPLHECTTYEIIVIITDIYSFILSPLIIVISIYYLIKSYQYDQYDVDNLDIDYLRSPCHNN